MSPEVEATAEESRRQVAGLVALWAAGTISMPTFRQLFVSIVYAFKVQAAVLAESILWRDYELQPLGIVPGQPSREALLRAVETITAQIPEVMPEGVPEVVDGPVVTFWSGIETRATRTAADAPKESARQTTRARLQRAGYQHWRWVSGPDACEECKAKDGSLHDIKTAMKDHPLCECDLAPVDPEEN